MNTNQKKAIFSIVDTKRDFNYDYEENTNSKGYVAWGKDNAYPQHIEYLAKNSATVKAIADGIVRYICGNGVMVPDTLAKWNEKVNRRGDTLEDIIEQVSWDYVLLGGFSIQVVYNHLGAVAEIYALSLSRTRSNVYNDKIYYAKKWGSYTAKYEEYDAFNREKIDPNKLTQIYFFKGASRRVYPIASWEGAFRDAETEIEAAKLQLNDMKNGLSAKVIITLPNESGTLTEDEKKAVEDAIQNKFCGSEATSSFFLTWHEEGVGDVKVDVIKQEDDSNKFINYKKSARENIFVAFKCTPELMGLPRENQGFDTSQVMDEFNLFQETVVSGYQRRICKALNQIFGVSQAEGIQIKPFNLQKLEEEE